ncbi:hypothetical protein IYY11_06270 [Methylocystis sp. H62]|uniref:hypothetical protein n=1 Tax=Methylocystis sp. H62 TaxID=2785789 RepID=UPI0018C32901|nr:hypothetical protein [Methylocystis sp. H62]MBG0792993.1 hypothetical protein [Methylocystis sp. H62]
MGPFLIAAIICGLSALLFATTLRPWLDSKRADSDSDQAAIPGATTTWAEAGINNQSYGSRWLVIAAILLLLLVALAEYEYIQLAHGSMNWQYFFDGPIFRQVVFGSVFGASISYWLLRKTVNKDHAKNDKQFIYVENEHAEQKPSVPVYGNLDTQKYHIYSELAVFIAFVCIFIVGTLDEETIARVAQLGGNVKLPGGVEFAFGRNESRSSETSVAHLVPPASSQNSYAPPSVSQGLQSLAELGQTMRRDALIYALRKQLIDDTDSAGEGSDSRNVKKSGEPDLLEILRDQIKLADEVFANLGKCLVEENKQNLDYISSGEKILPIAKTLNKSLRTGDKISNHELDALFPRCGNQNIFSKTKGDRSSSPNGIMYMLNNDRAAAFLNSHDAKILPYTWIAVANIFEYNHRYVAAIALLESWLRNKHWSIHDKDIADVFEIRVRSMIGGYLYEWMNYQPIAKTQAVLEYYRNNLDNTIELLERVIANVFARKNPHISDNSYGKKFTTAANWDCERHNPDAAWSKSVDIPDKDSLPPKRMKLALVHSLLTMKKSWINAVLDGQDYKYHKTMANEYARELKEMDVKCMALVGETKADPKGEDYIRVLRAENLDAYARVTRANANFLRDAAERKSRLSDALSAAEEGLELAKEIAERDRNERRFPRENYEVSFTTSGTPALEVVERLGEIINRANAELGRP